MPPANPNPLRLPMFKGSYTTAVFVTTGSALDDAISRQNTMRSTSDRPTDSSLESTASTAVAAAGGSMTSRLFDVLLEDHREAPVDIVAEPGKFDSVSSLIRSTTVPMSSTPVYVCCLDSSSPGGGAATGMCASDGACLQARARRVRVFSTQVHSQRKQSCIGGQMRTTF